MPERYDPLTVTSPCKVRVLLIPQGMSEFLWRQVSRVCPEARTHTSQARRSTVSSWKGCLWTSLLLLLAVLALLLGSIDSHQASSPQTATMCYVEDFHLRENSEAQKAVECVETA